MGTGIKRINDSMKLNNLKEATFEYYDHSFYVELNDSIVKKDEPLNEPINEPLNGPIKLDMIFEYIKLNPNCKRKDIEKNTKIPLGTLKRYLNELINADKIKKEGSKKTGGYVIVNNTKIYI